MISAEVLCHSINPWSSQLITFLLTYPRFIHSEFMTHRAFSRNAGSSRAIPFTKMVDDVLGKPAMPERWPAEQKGMQGGDQLSEGQIDWFNQCWTLARKACASEALNCHDENLHKSLCNRLLEPWAHITVIASMTTPGLRNFFALRTHPDAQPEFQVLAFRMLDAYLKSKPVELFWGMWHIPYASPKGIYQGDLEKNLCVIKPAVGRIARVSYNRHDQDDPVKNAAIHDRLQESGHWSPFEHVARASTLHDLSNFDSGFPDPHRCGWDQYRKSFPFECITTLAPEDIMQRKPEWITL